MTLIIASRATDENMFYLRCNDPMVPWESWNDVAQKLIAAV